MADADPEEAAIAFMKRYAAKTTKNSLHCNGQDYYVVPRYTDLKFLGSGSFGSVVSAKDTKAARKANSFVAIKKIIDLSPSICWLTFREMKVTAQLNHENIIGLENIILNAKTEAEVKEIYFIMPLMETDLKRLIDDALLSRQNMKTYLYGILRGVNYMHAACILHRDLKPANLLVNHSSLSIKIADFSLTRVFDPSGSSSGKLTPKAQSLNYRAPEVILSPSKYGTAIDIWSIGCIFGEMIGRQVMFKGNNKMNQIRAIYQVIGAQLPEDLTWVTSQSGRDVLLEPGMRNQVKIGWDKMFRSESIQCLDLLDQLLTFNPSKRIYGPDALTHVYFADVENPYIQPEMPVPAMEVLEEKPAAVIRQQLIDEVAKFRKDRNIQD